MCHNSITLDMEPKMEDWKITGNVSHAKNIGIPSPCYIYTLFPLISSQALSCVWRYRERETGKEDRRISCLPVAGWMDALLSGLWVYRIKLGGDEALFCFALRETHFLWGTLDCLSATHEVREGFTDSFDLHSRIASLFQMETLRLPTGGTQLHLLFMYRRNLLWKRDPVSFWWSEAVCNNRMNSGAIVLKLPPLAQMHLSHSCFQSSASSFFMCTFMCVLEKSFHQ